MNVVRIAMKEFKQIRNVMMAVFMLIIPVSLILILGIAFSNVSNGSITIGDIQVLYENENEESAVTPYWDSFMKHAEASGILFEQASDGTSGKLAVGNNQVEGFVEVGEDGITYYESSLNSIEGNIAHGIITTFTERYKLAAEAAKEHPELVNTIMSGGDQANFVQETSLQAARLPGSMDYYAIAVTTLIILYASMMAADLIDNERRRNTAARLLASPVTKGEIFAGKIVGNVALFAVYVVLIVFLSKYMFNAYWGDNLVMVFLVLFSEIVFALSLGLGLSYLMKGKAAGAVVMIIIQLGAFLGGSYFAVADMTGVMAILAKFSPLHWSNEAILQIIYADNLSSAFTAMLLNVGFSVLLLSIALFMMRRREGL